MKLTYLYASFLPSHKKSHNNVALFIVIRFFTLAQLQKQGYIYFPPIDLQLQWYDPRLMPP
jgi:hypothetical protein